MEDKENKQNQLKMLLNMTKKKQKTSVFTQCYCIYQRNSENIQSWKQSIFNQQGFMGINKNTCVSDV